MESEAEGGDRETALEFTKCQADPAYFLNEYGVIDDAQGEDTGGTMPFNLWPAQVDVIWRLMITPIVIILKARQLGISWVVIGYAVWLCHFQSGRVVLLFSHGQLEADELLRRCVAIYDRLPEWLRERSPLAKDPNTSQMIWENGSVIRSLPATQRAGRSFTASLVVMDEAAHMQWAEPLYTALRPTIDGGGQLIVISTANGIGNFFHRQWIKAVAGLNTFCTIFLPWWGRPGRDWAWYQRQLANESEPGKTQQEYPSTADEAFLVSGRVRFSRDWVTAQSKHIQAGLDSRWLPAAFQDVRGLLDGLVVYKFPEIGHRYILPADVAEGLEHGDYSSGVVIDAETLEEVADLHGHWEPGEFGRLLAALGLIYSRAEIIPERNNHGHAVLLALQNANYPAIAMGRDDKLGWHSNVVTKPQSIDALAELLRDGLVTIRTQATLDELGIYRVGPDGSTSAPSGYHDDRVMKWAIGVGYLKLRPAFPSLSGPGTDARLDRRDVHGQRRPMAGQDGSISRTPRADDDDDEYQFPGKRQGYPGSR